MEHCRTLAAFDGKTPVIVVIDLPESGTTEFLVVCPDERGLFAKIAGTLSANSMNILNASIATTVDAVALDTFYANYRGKSLQGDPKKERVIADLSRVLRGETTVEALMAEPRAGKFVRDRVPGTGPPASSSTTPSPRAAPWWTSSPTTGSGSSTTSRAR